MLLKSALKNIRKIVLVSSVASSALSTRRSLHDYAKFYILGLQWKQCALINLLQSAFIGAAALVFAVLGFFVIQYTPLSETFFIIWNGWLVLAMAVLLALYMLFSMAMPLAMMHAATPKELLQAESRLKWLGEINLPFRNCA